MAADICITSDDNSIIVTGSCNHPYEGSNIVTIMYDDDGIPQWNQKFNSTENDFAIQIHNEGNNEFIVGGRVYLGSEEVSTYLINYSKQGDVIWNISYFNEGTNKSLLSNFDIDFQGNIYIHSFVKIDDIFEYDIIKFNQPEKFNFVLTNYLKTLTVGLLGSASNEIVKNVLYDFVRNSIDSLHYITYAALIDSCNVNGYALMDSMEVNIKQFFDLNEEGIVRKIFQRNYILGQLVKPILVVPHYNHYSAAQLDSFPKLAYSFADRDYPISCINCDGATIDKDGVDLNITWISMDVALPWHHVNGDPTIYNNSCTTILPTATGDICSVCPPSTYGHLAVGPTPSTQDHEFELTLGYNNAQVLDACYPSSIITFPSFYPSTDLYAAQFAKIEAVQSIPHWHAIAGWSLPIGETRIEKIEKPFLDRLFWSYNNGNTNMEDQNNWLYSDNFTVCSPNSLFEEYNLSPGGGQKRFSLACGLFKISRPGSLQKPVFFYRPYSRGFWYSQGPDLGIWYGTEDGTPFNCPNGMISIEEDYYTEQCEYCSVGSQNFIPTVDIREHIATTDFSTIHNYWTTPAITIGFRTGESHTPAGLTGSPGDNIINFPAVQSPTPYTPPGGTLICTLELNAAGEYVVSKNLDQPYPPGETFTVRVIANFYNYHIDDCKTITVTPNSIQNLDFTNVIVEIRGSIQNYSASQINYLVEIYH